jgi:hypothetical protein
VSALTQLALSLFSFFIGLGAVAFVAHQRGYLKTAMNLLGEQADKDSKVSELESLLAERDAEIKHLKKRLREAQNKPDADRPTQNASPKALLLDSGPDSYVSPQAPTQLHAVSNDRPDGDIASLKDMKQRLHQVDMLTRSLPTKFKDVLRIGVTARDEQVTQALNAVEAISKLCTLDQSYVDSVLSNASNKSEELEIKGLLLKMRSSRANMYQVKSFIEENKTAHYHSEIIQSFEGLVENRLRA